MGHVGMHHVPPVAADRASAARQQREQQRATAAALSKKRTSPSTPTSTVHADELNHLPRRTLGRQNPHDVFCPASGAMIT